ncbi:MAG: glycosyltransferase family 2 protein [Planctomycetota bacterium]|jgi:glycosyltransferase involved in cell wall biosynthesis
MSDIEFSVIITCYYEENSIEQFYRRLSDTLKSIDRSYEIIFINDGSTDKTFEKLKMIFDHDNSVSTVVNLFKNAGQPAAVTAGISYARGNKIVLMDSDLQLDPEDLPLLIKAYDQGYDIVSGYRKNRKDSIFRILPSRIANIIMRKVSESNLTDFGCTFKIIDARLIQSFDLGPYKILHLPKVISKAQRCFEIAVNHHPRKYGKSGFTFKKLFAYNMDNMVSLSQRPFQILGVLCFVFAVLFLVRLILGPFFDFSILPQITPGLLLNVLVICTLILISILCLIGEYVIRNFIALQKYPAYIIKDIFQK